MQPYLFPYLGYFQLIEAADTFVIYDDIPFIKQGWINRNYMLLDGARNLFTIPVKNISSNILINETLVSRMPVNWEHKLIRTFKAAYQKAPFFKEVFPIIEDTFESAKGKAIAIPLRESIKTIIKYLDIQTRIVDSASIYSNQELKNQSRVIDICKKENACYYINAIGGRDLYDKKDFEAAGIDLKFLKNAMRPYPQFNQSFTGGLSIIDVMMFNPPDTIKNYLLQDYSLL